MKHYAGLDVSMKETSICVVDERRRVITRVKSRGYAASARKNADGRLRH